MKKLVILSATMALIAGFAGTSERAWGQNDATSANAPHKIGLIDMAHVFKNYKKFEVLREDLKAEIQQTDERAKTMANQIKSLQDEMKNFKEGSPEFLAKEKEVAKLVADFEAFRKVAQKDFLRKESQIYRTVYLEVTDAVNKYAQYYKYTLIIRFNRETVEDAKNPQDILQQMNREVIFYRTEDDVTLSVLDYLNRVYTKQASGGGNTQTN